MKKLILVLVAVTGVLVSATPDYYLDFIPDRVLFVGNSYTHADGGQPNHVMGLASAAGDPDTITAVLHSHGGYTLKEHWIDNEAQPKIRTGNYDAVVLQEYARIYPGTAELDTFLHYAALFDALIDSVGAKTVFFLTWPNGMFDFSKLKIGNDSAGVLLDAAVVPTGLGWQIVNADRPTINLYAADGNHPGEAGVYLNACMFYSAFTRKSPVGNPYDPAILGLDADTRAFLQGAAWDAMRDFIEGPCTDGSAPAAPTGLAGDVSSTEVTGISWDAAVHAACGGVNRYYVYRDGGLLGVAYGTSFNDYDFLGGHDYDYTVTAEGLNGMVSVSSAVLSLTTADDTIPPVLTEARHTRKGGEVTLVFSEPLDTASAETPVNYTIDNGITVQTAALGADGYEVTLTVSPLTQDIDYTVTVSNVKDNSRLKNTITAGSQATFQYIPLSLMADCIGYWPCDGTLEDFSPYGNDGKWQNGDASYGAGYMGSCLSLTGDSLSPYVSVPYDSIYGGMSQLTISMWIQKSHADSAGYLLNKYGIYTIFIDNDRIRGEITTDSGTRVLFQKETSLIDDTEWHHLVLAYDGSRTVLYVDAVQVWSAAQTGTVGGGTRGLLIGKFPYMHKKSFYGKIDEIRMYETGLDSTKVSLLFHEDPGTDGAADSAAVRWILDRNMIGETVDAVTVRDIATGRVLSLQVDSLLIDHFDDHIGQLTAMRSLYCTGAPAPDTSLISIDGAIGQCTALETLILADNQLASLPDGIVNLTNLVLLDVSGNKLCSVSDPVKTWLDTYDPDWADSQTGCTTAIVRLPEQPVLMNLEEGMLLDSWGRMISRQQAASGIYLRYDTVTGQLIKTVIIK